ncbi:tRNA (adenosine(37)-N6)-threonylcarbamoyltransferase complex ATPase subunit type 1 TsaE [Brevundimonas sp. 2R-24]|uniref:tRNA threonylcarbamoyladenosine biosynthesis protein TsaE n=1 Tax=Peiella sedimenti TaxID=3061083 RepID=A0ABT8SIP7_9CAUL|nr:tRNA (adenosine(37)-N6)-threonylcarbamoyltransferase complex ATPase subunit type 1 TsaE [Caulobacteraceae bacterium XZ-24]
MRLFLADEAATLALGARLADLIQRGDVLLLRGGLGAGKSTLARGLIRALTTPDEDVPSPTFTLVQTYEGRAPVAHFDLYRLENPEEARELGIEEALEEGAVLIEWPERLGGWIPGGARLDIELRPEQTGRAAILSAGGSWSERLREFI